MRVASADQGRCGDVEFRPPQAMFVVDVDDVAVGEGTVGGGGGSPAADATAWTSSAAHCTHLVKPPSRAATVPPPSTTATTAAPIATDLRRGFRNMENSSILGLSEPQTVERRRPGPGRVDFGAPAGSAAARQMRLAQPARCDGPVASYEHRYGHVIQQPPPPPDGAVATRRFTFVVSSEVIPMCPGAPPGGS